MTLNELVNVVRYDTRLHVHNDISNNIVFDGDVPSIPDKYKHCDVSNVRAIGCDNIVHVDIAIKYTFFNDLNVEGKVNCMGVFCHRVADITEFESLEDVIYSINELLCCSEYTIDDHGNWYDEDGDLI